MHFSNYFSMVKIKFGYSFQKKNLVKNNFKIALQFVNFFISSPVQSIYVSELLCEQQYLLFVWRNIQFRSADDADVRTGTWYKQGQSRVPLNFYRYITNNFLKYYFVTYFFIIIIHPCMYKHFPYICIIIVFYVQFNSVFI